MFTICLVLKRQNFKCLRPLTFAGFVVRLQPVSSRAGAVVANLQIVAVVRAAAISGQTLIVVCRDKQAKSFQIIFTTTKSLADREFTHSNHKLGQVRYSSHISLQAGSHECVQDDFTYHTLSLVHQTRPCSRSACCTLSPCRCTPHCDTGTCLGLHILWKRPGEYE